MPHMDASQSRPRPSLALCACTRPSQVKLLVEASDESEPDEIMRQARLHMAEEDIAKARQWMPSATPGQWQRDMRQDLVSGSGTWPRGGGPRL